MIDAAVARDLVAHLATEPRPAGSAAEARLRAECAEWLRASGFEVTEERFDYSALPGKYATPAGGVAFILMSFGAAVLASDGRAGVAIFVLSVTALALAVVARWAARSGVTGIPFSRATSTNLVARRGVPTTWLVAHQDTKSQPVPMLLRAGGIAACVITWIVAMAMGVAQWTQAAHMPADAWRWPVIAALVAATPVVLSVVTSVSPGAVDNASGVAAALLVARATARERPLGVLITSAEELGLAGARAWAATNRPQRAINFDGLDDGPLLVMTHGILGELRAAVETAARSAGVPVRITRGIPGVLTDALALRDAGWDTLTLASGTPGTLSRVHTARDRAENLTGAGIASAAAVALRMLEETS